MSRPELDPIKAGYDSGCETCKRLAGYAHALEQSRDFQQKQYRDAFEILACDRPPMDIKTLADYINYLKDQLEDSFILIEEAIDIFDCIRQGEYKVDSFTSQPYRLLLEKYKKIKRDK